MAELEILEALVSFLCPTNEAASSCREFIQNHSSVLPPIGPIFYFLLFPMVFSIVFIYILSSTILHGGNLTKGIRVLIGVSVFIFIIISGLYPVALVLSEIWFIVIILLFGMWYFLTKHRGGGGGGGGAGGGGGGGKGAMPGFGGVFGAVLSTAGKYRSGRIRELDAEIDSYLTAVEETRKSRHKNDYEARAYMQSVESANNAIERASKELQADTKILGKSTINDFIKKKRSLLGKIQSGDTIFTK